MGDRFTLDRDCSACIDKFLVTAGTMARELEAARDFERDRFERAMGLADHLGKLVGTVAGVLTKLQRDVDAKVNTGKIIGAPKLDPYNLGRTLETISEVMRRGGVIRSMLLSSTVEDWSKRTPVPVPVPVPVPGAAGPTDAPEAPPEPGAGGGAVEDAPGAPNVRRGRGGFKLLEGGARGPTDTKD